MNEIILRIETQIKILERQVSGSSTSSLDDLSDQGAVLEKIENLRLAKELVECSL